MSKNFNARTVSLTCFGIANNWNFMTKSTNLGGGSLSQLAIKLRVTSASAATEEQVGTWAKEFQSLVKKLGNKIDPTLQDQDDFAERILDISNISKAILNFMTLSKYLLSKTNNNIGKVLAKLSNDFAETN